jgi:hypothetical protein
MVALVDMESHWLLKRSMVAIESKWFLCKSLVAKGSHRLLREVTGCHGKSLVAIESYLLLYKSLVKIYGLTMDRRQMHH